MKKTVPMKITFAILLIVARDGRRGGRPTAAATERPAVWGARLQSPARAPRPRATRQTC